MDILINLDFLVFCKAVINIFFINFVKLNEEKESQISIIAFIESSLVPPDTLLCFYITNLDRGCSVALLGIKVSADDTTAGAGIFITINATQQRSGPQTSAKTTENICK